MTVQEMTIEELMSAGAPPPGKVLAGEPVGRPEAELWVSSIRPLKTHDLALSPAPTSYQSSTVSALRTRHHKLARLIASGNVTQTQAATATGYGVMRVSMLMQDPAFLNLVDHYKKEVDEIYITTHERLAELLVDGTEILAERLEENPDGFTNVQLMELVKTTADRTGHGVSTTQKVEATVTPTTDLLNEVKDAVKEAQNGQARKIYQTIEASAVEAEVTSGRGIDQGLQNGLSAIEVLAIPQDEGSTSKGQEV